MIPNARPSIKQGFDLIRVHPDFGWRYVWHSTMWGYTEGTKGSIIIYGMGGGIVRRGRAKLDDLRRGRAKLDDPLRGASEIGQPVRGAKFF